jgi:hypothetical protein
VRESEIRTDVHQCSDGFPGTPDCNALERFTDLVEQHNGHTFRVFSDGECANGGNGHQEVFVKDLSFGYVL